VRYRQLLLATAFVAAVATTGAAKATTYISDPTLGDFASASTDFATLSNYADRTFGLPVGSYTTTLASLAMGGRVYDGGMLSGLPGSDWILATFSSAVSSIRVFPNIDHPNSAFDVYEYSIEGSNDGMHWTPLFNADSVGAGPQFQLTGFTGTAPTRVDAVDTAACSPGPDCVGYIADFNFGTSYKYYAFGPSVAGGDNDQELSGVSALNVLRSAGVPELASWAMLLGGLGLVGAALRSQGRKASPTPA
jgi:hypothetical protein